MNKLIPKYPIALFGLNLASLTLKSVNSLCLSQLLGFPKILLKIVIFLIR